MTDPDYSFTLSLKSGTRIVGQRDRSQVPEEEQKDDHGRRADSPWAIYGAVFVDTGFDHEGNITIRSAADIEAGNRTGVTIGQATIRARGIYARHQGRSGDLNIHLADGTITSTGPGVHAHIDSQKSGENSGNFKDAEFEGNIDIDLSPGATIRTSGDNGDGVQAHHRGRGKIRLTATGKADSEEPDIGTTGNDAGGISVEMGNWWDDFADSARGDIGIDLRNYFIRTTGDRGVLFGSGLKVYNYISGDIDVDVTGSRIKTQAQRGIYAWRVPGERAGGRIDIDVRNSEIATGVQGKNGNHAIIAQHQSTGTGLIAIDVDSSEISTRGADSHAVYGRHFGAGDVVIAARDSEISTQDAGSYGIYGRHQYLSNYRFWARLLARGTPAANYAVRIDVDGGRICADRDDRGTEDPGDDICQGTGIVAEIAESGQNDRAEVDLAGAVVQGSTAVEFRGVKGALRLTDSHLAGDIRFARGDYNDALHVKLDRTSRRLAGDIDFSGGEDKMTVDIARGQHLAFDGPISISGLESLTKRGDGWVRFADNVNFEDGSLRLEDGHLVVAGRLNLGNGRLTIEDAGRLVFEAGQDVRPDDSKLLWFGQLLAGEVHFADAQGDPAVFLQLSEGLDEAAADQVREFLAAGPLALITGRLTQGSNDDTVMSLALRSLSDGTVSEVGTVNPATGVATITENMKGRIGRLKLPGTISLASIPSSGGTAGGGSGSGSGGSAGSGSSGGILGLGLLAVLLASFGADEEAEEASWAGYGIGAPGAAYAVERVDGGDRMWMRTARPMTGITQAGVSGAAAGLSLHEGDHFYLGASAAPAVTARVDSLNLAARGAVHSLRAGWRAERWFAGLRLSQGDFQVATSVANPATSGALASRFALRSAQAQLRAGLHLDAGALRFTPSAAVQAGRLAHSAHVAESPALRARVPAFSQDYTGWQLGLRMSASRWLDAAGGGRWQPQLQFQTIRTTAAGGAVSLRQADRLGALSFNTPAGIRALPKAVHSLRLGARVRPAGHRGIWKLGLAGLEADGEAHYAALAAYQLRF